MSSYKDDTDLGAALRALQPIPRPQFAAELDARAAAGFPRRETPEGSPLSRAFAKLRATPPRRLLLPAGGLAVTAIIVATAVLAVTQNDSGSPGGAEHGGAVALTRLSAPSGEATTVAPSASSGESAAKHATGPAPEVAESAGSASSAQVEYGAGSPAAGPYASKAGDRDIERGASMVLGADPSQVRGDAAKVFEAVHAADGIVLRSTIRDGSGGDAGADFELLIPAARLSDALAAFSGIAEVRSRHESTADITAPTVSAQEHLRDSNARIQSLLTQLAGAESDAERVEVEVELQAERRHAASLRSQLSSLDRRANLSHVSLRIETGAPTAENGGGGAWGVGDGFGDASRILAIAAGVTVIGLAILAPLAGIFLLGWLARRAWLRHARAGALA